MRGYPRVYAIALELVGHTEGEIDEKVLVKFLQAYQSQTLLSMGELWAVVIMFRIALIEKIRQVCEKINESREQWYKAEDVVESLTAQTWDENEGMAGFMSDRLGSDLNPSFVEHLLLKLRKKGIKPTNVVSYLDDRLMSLIPPPQQLQSLNIKYKPQGSFPWVILLRVSVWYPSWIGLSFLRN